MKLAEATSFANLRDSRFVPKTLSDISASAQRTTGLALATDVIEESAERGNPFKYHTPETWNRKWLASKKFVLVDLPLNAAALPCEPATQELVLKKIHAREEKPIIVDYNKRRIGGTLNNGFIPDAIVLDGKHRFKAAMLRGDVYIKAWVGEKALDTITCFSGNGGGGPDPSVTTPSKGAALVAEGKRLKTLNVKRKTVKAFGTSEGAYAGWENRAHQKVGDWVERAADHAHQALDAHVDGQNLENMYRDAHKAGRFSDQHFDALADMADRYDQKAAQADMKTEKGKAMDQMSSMLDEALNSAGSKYKIVAASRKRLYAGGPGSGRHPEGGSFDPNSQNFTARMGGTLRRFGYEKTSHRLSGGQYQKKVGDVKHTVTTAQGGWAHKQTGGQYPVNKVTQGTDTASLREHLSRIHGEQE